VFSISGQPAKTDPTRKFGLSGLFGLKIPSPQWFALGYEFQNSELAQPNPTRQPAISISFIFFILIYT